MEPPRILKLRTGQAVIDEIDHLRQHGYSRGGKWSLSQVCEHVGKAIDSEMQGTAKRLPWIIRWMFAEPAAHWIVRRGKFPTFMIFPSPKFVLPSDSGSAKDDDGTIDWCREVIQQADQFTGPLPPLPFADSMSVEDWRLLNWIHAAHHLGFLIPNK